jgi:hypothetical protein
VEILTQNKMDKVAVKHVVYSLEQNTTQRIKKEVDGARVRVSIKRYRDR